MKSIFSAITDFYWVIKYTMKRVIENIYLYYKFALMYKCRSKIIDSFNKNGRQVERCPIATDDELSHGYLDDVDVNVYKNIIYEKGSIKNE